MKKKKKERTAILQSGYTVFTKNGIAHPGAVIKPSILRRAHNEFNDLLNAGKIKEEKKADQITFSSIGIDPESGVDPESGIDSESGADSESGTDSESGAASESGIDSEDNSESSSDSKVKKSFGGAKRKQKGK